MRVSTTVKDYVRKEIAKAMPYKERPDISEVKEEWEALRTELKENIKNAYINFFTAHPEVETTYKYDKNVTMVEFLDRMSLLASMGELIHPTITEIKEFNREIDKKREEKFEEIIVTLELGGTKADLDKMLKDLM
jgi:hypothetical protein